MEHDEAHSPKVPIRVPRNSSVSQMDSLSFPWAERPKGRRPLRVSVLTSKEGEGCVSSSFFYKLGAITTRIYHALSHAFVSKAIKITTCIVRLP
jgi:hypothetical protein